MLQEYLAYAEQTKKKLKELPKSSKRWWRLAKTLAKNTKAKTGLPPLKKEDGTWVRTPQEKAELFLDTFTKKYKLPASNSEVSADLGPRQEATPFDGNSLPIRTRNAIQVLRRLREDSATGPDHLATKVLKRCAKNLGRPVALLARLLLNCGRWPKLWRVDWVFPLYKKRSVYDPGNYRGLHLTAQLSKAVERLIGRLFLPFLESTGAYGPNQFAYRKHRGCKDALALNVLQ